MRFAKFSALEGGSVTVVCVAHGRDMHYTYLMSATLRCSGIVPFCGVCGQAVWYVASSHYARTNPEALSSNRGGGSFLDFLRRLS
jgi:hypothetical protein